MSYKTTLLAASHEKARFSCGNTVLDDYIKKQANQDLKKRVSVCFVLSDDATQIKGYYTLSNGSIPWSELPEWVIKQLPRYKDMPITLLDRLAVDNKFKGQKLGSLLLIDALKRSLDIATGNIASMAVIVDPIDKEAAAFYAKFGFVSLPNSNRMFLPMATIEQLF